MIGRGDRFDGIEGVPPLALLLNHDEFEGTAHEGADDSGGDARSHLLVGFEAAVFASQDGFFEGASHGELDHGAASHVDGVGAHAAVEFAGVEGEGLALLEGVFAVVEGLEAENFDDADWG